MFFLFVNSNFNLSLSLEFSISYDTFFNGLATSPTSER